MVPGFQTMSNCHRKDNCTFTLCKPSHSIAKTIFELTIHEFAKQFFMGITSHSLFTPSFNREFYHLH